LIAALILICISASDSIGAHRSTLLRPAAAVTQAVLQTADAIDTAPDASDTSGPSAAQPMFVSSEAFSESLKGARIGDSLPVSRAMAAKMLALAFFSENHIESMDREISFTDTTPDDWFDKYINAVWVQGCMKGGGDIFEPNAPLLLEQVQAVLTALDPGHKIRLKISDANKSKPVSYALWTEIYQNLLRALQIQDVQMTDFIVLAAAGNNRQLKDWYMISDIGPYHHAGLNMDSYIDKRIQILERDNEIAALLSVADTSPWMANAYIVSAEAHSVTVFSGGVERTYEYAKTLADAAGKICDIRIQGGKALDVQIMSDNVSGAVMRTSATEIEINQQALVRNPNFKVYSVADGPVKWKDMKNIIVGTDMAVFVLKDGRACAGVITKNVSPVKIRIALQTTGFEGFIHKSVKLTCSTAYTVTAGSKEKHLKAGEIFNADELARQGRMFVKPDKNGGMIEIKTIARNWPGGQSPAYAGAVEIGLEAGGYSLVNELPLEEYLYAVVPSEMPESNGLDAAKVQAVTARSYAFNQFYENRFHQYGANVDDSVSCQVYNNIPASDVSRKAVDATKGLVLTDDGQVISANFFSTSSGMTASSGEVWASPTKEFPTASSPYLVSAKQYAGPDYGDLSQEENAAAFLKESGLDSFDSGFSWFRWTVDMSAAELAASINANLKARYEAAPALIKTRQDGEVYRSRPIDSIGALLDLQVTKRGAGGNIMELKIIGDKAVILVETEYNIRYLLRPSRYLKDGKAITVNRCDGTFVENYTLMPSAFFTMDKAFNPDGALTGVKFYGGGNGHGVGMSQNGVKGMIDSGSSLPEIFTHYYPGTELKKIEA
jgi:stage II sporulation protein D